MTDRPANVASRWGHYSCLLLSLAPSGAASAHSFDTPYALPIPIGVYAYGSIAILLLTFLLAIVMSAAPVVVRGAERNASRGRSIPAAPLAMLRAGALSCLAIVILDGLTGRQDPLESLAATIFWGLFLAGFPYVTLVVGDIYRLINPWMILIHGLERLGLDLSRERYRYPQSLGVWPAVALYLVLAWVEIFLHPSPAQLADVLAIYTLAAACASFLFGKTVWFECIDPLSTYFRLIGRMAPVTYAKEQTGRWKATIHAPFIKLLDLQPASISILCFILCILAATTYDPTFPKWPAA